MSKLDIGVGDEFPLEEGQPRHGRRRGHRGRHHGLHGHRPHHFRHHHHHFHVLPLLLIVAGIAALVVAGKIPAIAAYVMIGLGILALLAFAFAAMRHIRRFHRPTQ